MQEDKIEMGGRWNWFAVRGNDGRLSDALWQMAGTQGWSQLNLRAMRRGEWLALAFGDHQEAEADRWAQAISRQLACMTVSFFAIPRAFIHHTDEHHSSWDFKVFSGGRHLGGIEMVFPPVPVLLGDVVGWSTALGVESGVAEAYVSQSRRFVRTGATDTRAFPDDEVPAWKGPAHMWFAARIGIAHPFSEKALPMGVRLKPFKGDIELSPVGELPEQMSWAGGLPEDVDEYLKAETLQQQRLILGFAENAVGENPSAALSLLSRVSHPSLVHKTRFVSLMALTKRDGFQSHRAAVIDFAQSWLQPAQEGATNQSVDRAAVMQLLEGRGDRQAEALAVQVASASEPEPAWPEGDLI